MASTFQARLPALIKEDYDFCKVPVDPYPNPAVDRLRKKLKRQRLAHTETAEGDFVVFKAV